MVNIPRWIIVHTEGSPIITNAPRFEIVNQEHRTRFNMKSSLGYWVGYGYFIEKSGKTIQCRADTEMGAHTKGFNDNIGICLAGNGDIEPPTEAQITALKELLARKTKEHNISRENIVPHRHFLEHREKTCYGKLLANDWAQNLVPEIAPTGESPAEKITLLKQLIALYQKLLAFLQTQKVGGRDYDHL